MGTELCMPGVRWSWSKVRLYSVGLAGLIFLSHSIIMLGVRDATMREKVNVFSFPLWSLLATVLFYVAARQAARYTQRTAWAWYSFALAELLTTGGNISGLVSLFGLPIPETLEYGFYLGFYPFALSGVLLLPTKRSVWSAWGKTALDIAIVLVSVTLVLWSYWLGPLIVAEGRTSLSAQIILLATPVGDLVLLWALLLIYFHPPEGQPRAPAYLYWLILAVGSSMISDSNFGYQYVRGNFSNGDWLDLGWVVASLCFMLAGVWQITNPQSITSIMPKLGTTSGPAAKLHTWSTYLPYGWAVAVYLMLAQIPRPRGYLEISWLTVAVGLVIGLALLRQMMTLRENNVLFSQVRQQASALQLEVYERKKAEAQLVHDALHDALTGLPNRVLFTDRLRHALARATQDPMYSFSVLFLDLDQFKIVNDSLGHAMGDQLLIAITQRLRACLQCGDIVARLGGDEFVLLVEDTKAGQNAITTAGRIQDLLQQPFNVHAQRFVAAASIGIVTDAGSYRQPEDILRDADIAMYQAKIQGKARSQLFNTQMGEQAQSRLALGNDLRVALERRELELYYQPIISLESDYITGFEALMRWHHPQRGLLAPTEFIPIAEETGLIVPIGQWGLQEACHQLRIWQLQFPQTPALTMSVNVSSLQLDAPGFGEQVAQTLQVTEIDPSTLRLELTESVWLNSTSSALTLFQQLSRMGIQLHIDDFGTGYSSLAYLQHFPVRILKIDRTFLHKMGEDRLNQGLVRAMITMAHDLGIETVAEGVETVEQLNRLKQFGCNYGQGYLLSRPVNRTEIEQLLTQKQEETFLWSNERESFGWVDEPDLVQQLFAASDNTLWHIKNNKQNKDFEI